VVLQRQFSVGVFDFIFRRGLLNSQNFVIVSFVTHFPIIKVVVQVCEDLLVISISLCSLLSLRPYRLLAAVFLLPLAVVVPSVLPVLRLLVGR